MEDIDFGKRDKRGNWKPNYKVTPNPKVLTRLTGFQGRR